MMQRLSKRIKHLMDNQHVRHDWIRARLADIPRGQKILDAGCGSQRYRKDCEHLHYHAQDFGKYVSDEKESMTAGRNAYTYGKLDYIGNIWSIAEADAFFDIILCTEVFEHIPYPNETITEFARLLRPGGKLILTVPANCLRHMDPFFFYSGFSDRYFEKLLPENAFEILSLETVGSYHAWLMVETARSMRNDGIAALLCLWPALIYHYLRQRNPSRKAINTLCFGYHVLARRRIA
jgi:2-polyprenyl-3-methyl-5-hydroxy-6-metoxy-1,4-benzoquinol methylase